MTDLVEFLRARLHEDTQAAEEAGDSWYGYEPEQQIAFVSTADARHIAATVRPASSPRSTPSGSSSTCTNLQRRST